MDPEKLRQYLQTQCVSIPQPDDLCIGLSGNGHRCGSRSPVRPDGGHGDPILEMAETLQPGRYRRRLPGTRCGSNFRRRRIAGERRVSMGRAAAFSFYPGKNLGACGEGGAVTTDDEAIARKVRMFRDHGQSRSIITTLGLQRPADAFRPAFCASS